MNSNQVETLKGSEKPLVCADTLVSPDCNRVVALNNPFVVVFLHDNRPPPIATAASHGHTVDPAASRPLAQQQTTQCARFSEFYFICITIFITPIKRHCISQKTNRVVGLQFCLLIDDISVCVLHKVADTGFNNCCLLLNSIMCIFVTKMLMI